MGARQANSEHRRGELGTRTSAMGLSFEFPGNLATHYPRLRQVCEDAVKLPGDLDDD